MNALIKFFVSDLFKIGLVAIIITILVFFLADRYVLQALSLSSQLQERNQTLNRKFTESVLLHKNTLKLAEANVFGYDVACVKKYITDKASNIMLSDIEKMSKLIVINCRKNKIPIEFVVALIDVSSSFNPTLNRGDAHGLMMIPKTGDDIRSLYALEHNIKVGTERFTNYVNTSYGDIVRAYQAYNSNLDGELLTAALYKFISFRETFMLDKLAKLDAKGLRTTAASVIAAEIAMAKEKTK